jgi:hypothetical protein
MMCLYVVPCFVGGHGPGRRQGLHRPPRDHFCAPSATSRTLTREQFDVLVEHLRPNDRLLVMLLRWTGLRIAEALGLRWEDLCDHGDGPVLLVRRQWQDGRLVKHTKTSAGPARSPSSRVWRAPWPASSATAASTSPVVSTSTPRRLRASTISTPDA